MPDVPVLPDTILVGSGDSKMPMQDSTALAFEQGFQMSHQGAMHAFRRLMDASDFVNNQANMSYLGQQSLFAAKAAQTLATDKLADSILQQRSAEAQPQIKAA